jgi:hypothetical protein
MAEDERWTRSLFYIGTDSLLYQVGNLDYEWHVFARPNESFWPRADSGELAVASDFSSSSTRVYYMSGGRLIEANGDEGDWQPAMPLPAFNASAPVANNTEPTPTPTPASSGLTSGAKAGIGVGVSLGIIALGGMAAAFLFMRQRQKKLDEKTLIDAQNQHPKSSLSYSPTQPGAYADYYGDTGTYSEYPNSTYPGSGVGGYPGAQGYAAPGAAAYSAQNYANVPNGWAQQGATVTQPQPAYIYHEMPDNMRPTEMLGEGHYSEMVGEGHYKEMTGDGQSPLGATGGPKKG